MSSISVENLTFAYPGSYDNVFEDVSFQIDTDWKLGFVGRNGRGKTTFLNLLMGKYEYSGKITASVGFAYFPYPVASPQRLTSEILEEVCPDAEDWQLLRELSLLRVEEDVLQRPFDTLSGGEQTKVLLAALFLNPEKFLLIDEPTNHLDVRAREQVAEYLRRKRGFILVSHDRYFLDGCVDHILSLNRADIQVQSGDFSAWMENFTRQQDFELERNARLEKDVKRLQQSARRASNWSDKVERSKNGAFDKGYIGHKSAKMMKRAKAFEARTEAALEERRGLLKNLETAEELKLFPQRYHSRVLAEFREVSVCYGGKPCGDPVTFTVERGDRVVLTGKNGSGKTSLLRCLLGEEVPRTGIITVGSGLTVSVVPQQTGHLRGTVFAYAEENGLDEVLFLAILRKMDFERVQFEKNMAGFSGGQKKKVLIAKSLCEQAHLYLWDEPLNFIDLYSRLQIEALIREFQPTMVLVEHDRAFQKAVGTKFVEV